MKSNIVGWLYIISSSVFFLMFLVLFVLPLVSQGGSIEDESQPIRGVLALLLAVFSLVWGSALRKHKKWSLYIGLILIPLVLIGNTISIVFSFEAVLLLPLLLNAFSIYALVSEKNLFV